MVGAVARGGLLLALLGRFFGVDVALRSRSDPLGSTGRRLGLVSQSLFAMAGTGSHVLTIFQLEIRLSRNAKEAAGGKDAQKVGGLEGFGHAVVLVGARGALVLFRKLPSLYCQRLIGLLIQYFDNCL
jgi:hypothetical protein